MRVVVYASKEVSQCCQKELEPFGIEVSQRRSALWQQGSLIGIDRFDAALLDLEGSPRDQWHDRVAALQSRGVCVVGIAGPEVERPWQEHPEDDLDAVVPAGCGGKALACALWSAHRQFELRRVLAQRVGELELTLQRRKRIEQAKSVLAEMMNVTEGEALRHLRREARNQRRSMHELAHVVIEARDLLRPLEHEVPHARGRKTAESLRPVLAR
jgi:AmiR/NasT family two-component response regulator